MKIGDKVKITGHAHPWRGQVGEYVSDRSTFLGPMPQVKLGNGLVCNVIKYEIEKLEQ